jgi:hypothetical protein
MKVISVLCVLCVLCGEAVLADLVEQGPKDSPPSGLLAGVARAEITAPIGIIHLNWGSQTHVEAAGADPVGMYATALVLSDGRQKFAMVDIDIIGVQGLDGVRTRAAAVTGIPEDHIRLGATHTHAGAQFSPNRGPLGADLSRHRATFDNYRATLADKVVGAVAEANSRLRPVHLYAGRGVGTININRRVRGEAGRPPAVGRNPEGFVDRELNVIRIDDAQGNPFAVIVNFQCHGTVLAYENKYLSPDWIGPMRQVVERNLPGAKCLFFQGAAGNQGPVEGFTGDLNVARRLGSILGHQATTVALEIETVRREPTFEGFVESTAFQAKQHWRVKGPRDATLKLGRRTIEVPRRRYTPEDLAEMEQRVADAKARLDDTHMSQARLRRLQDLLAQWKRPYDPTPLPVEVQILRIGDVAIVAMPGEPFAEIGAAIKKASPFPYTLFCGYSNGRTGDYMPIESEYKYGGYEVERTPYGLGAADKVISETISLFAQVR